LVTRSLFLELVAVGETPDLDRRRMFGVTSAGEFFPMAPAETAA
jgi:hypothetical protein